MLIHEMSSGEKFLEVIVADVNCDGHADGRPESRYKTLLLFDRMYSNLFKKNKKLY